MALQIHGLIIRWWPEDYSTHGPENHYVNEKQNTAIQCELLLTRQNFAGKNEVIAYLGTLRLIQNVVNGSRLALALVVSIGLIGGPVLAAMLQRSAKPV